jgi:RHS repeat-associated protein
MGNRLSLQDSSAGTTNYTYNASNMLLSAGGNAYNSDLDGNTLSGGGRTNTWDSQSRLIGCTYNGHTTGTVYGYDGLRRQSTIDGVTTDYLLDGQNAVQEGHAVNGTFTSTATYFNGMYRRDDVATTVRWYLMDGLGSMVGEVDPSGNLTCSRGFDVYGATRCQTGTPTSKHGYVGKLGHETEDACALEYMRARWYDPAVGRFISEDPGRHGGNWFAYCSDNPTGSTDRSGRDDFSLDSLSEAEAAGDDLEEGDAEASTGALDSGFAPGRLFQSPNFGLKLGEHLGYSPTSAQIDELLSGWNPVTAEPARGGLGRWFCEIAWRNQVIGIIAESDGEAVTAFPL